MPSCHECSAPFTPALPLAALVCSACDECPVSQCRDCGNHHVALEAERCEGCAETNARALARDRRDAMRESYGDWLRDEGKDGRAW